MRLPCRAPLLSVLLLGFFCFFDQTSSYAGTIFFDQAHGQAFVVEKEGPLDLSGLARLFTDQGNLVQVNRTKFSTAAMQGIKSLIVSGPFTNFSSHEIDSLMEWLADGGRLALLLHIPKPVMPLLRKLGVVVSHTPINENARIIANNPKNFSVTTLMAHPITAGLKIFQVYGIWGVMNSADNARVIAAASPKAWIDMNNDQQLGKGDGVYPYGLVVAGRIGNGEFVVFGDDAIFQNQFLSAENRRLAVNVSHWLQRE